MSDVKLNKYLKELGYYYSWNKPCTTLGDFIIKVPKFRRFYHCRNSRPIPISFYNFSNKFQFEVLKGEVPSRDKFKEQKENARKER